MAARTDLHGWSQRAAGRATGLGLRTIRTLLALDLWEISPGPLEPLDVLCLKVLGELGAPRTVNDNAADERTRRLRRRDRDVVRVIRTDFVVDGFRRDVRLVVAGSDVRLLRKDLELMNLLDDRRDEGCLVLPLGKWWNDLLDAEAALRSKRPSPTSPAAGAAETVASPVPSAESA